MIKNYLDFVKRMRKGAIFQARRCMNESRKGSDEWCNGFYRGLKLGFEFESHHWRILQKDIEASLVILHRDWPLNEYDPILQKFDI